MQDLTYLAPTSIRLFKTFILPILLYNTENWSTLTDKKLKQFTENTLFDGISDSKADVMHRKLLKFVLGVSKSCTNLAVYAETNEIPISLKAYRLTLNFWHRVSNSPDSTLAKKAMLENIRLRTNWIITIEKLINRFNLADKIGNHNRFKKAAKDEIEKAYLKCWQNELEKPGVSRLEFYREIKGGFKKENYLDIENFEHRRPISQLRCSDHLLEIDAGRHRKIDRHVRLCNQCANRAIGTSEQLMNDLDPIKLGIYLTEAF